MKLTYSIVLASDVQDNDLIIVKWSLHFKVEEIGALCSFFALTFEAQLKNFLSDAQTLPTLREAMSSPTMVIS